MSSATSNQLSRWIVNSNEALRLSFVTGSPAQESFSPTFTYPVFGEEEKIFGYQGLDINVCLPIYTYTNMFAQPIEHV